MLELKDIGKDYRTGSTVTKALEHVSITFRDGEFAAILGPSGSGKTTLLNIIGGLDRYDHGDLIINGTSTKEFSDRDFDAYRNHTIGFIFQSYNLIPHQTILANVELALTISGITGKERRQRAEEALQKVGLGDHMHKRPNQLSGGQMQRVAIARALVNDPDIILADEPTGALDTKTSIQVMDLLQEVAKDRLVIMVTHNPELARQYATRIITIKDGHVTNDTNPLHPAEIIRKTGQKLSRTAMHFTTALALSFNNLRTKKARTFLVSLAGSIGIIGIALLLAIEQGLGTFIEAQESQALSAYPLEIYASGVDVSSLIDQSSTVMQDAAEQRQDMTISSFFTKDAQEDTEQLQTIEVNPLAENFLSGVNANDLASLKKYLDQNEEKMNAYASSIAYSYGIEPLIYQVDEEGNATAVNPNAMIEDLASAALNLNGILSSSVAEAAFHPLPSDPDAYEDDYIMEAGRWPQDEHEMVLVLAADGTIPDLTLYEIGVWDSSRLQQMVNAFSSSQNSALMNALNQFTTNEEVSDASSASSEKSTFTCQDFLGMTYKLVHNSDCYTYDENLGLWTDRSDDQAYVNALAAAGEDMTIVGVAMAKENSSLLSPGIYYPRSLITSLIAAEKDSAPVQAQLASPDTDIFTGQSFASENSEAMDYGRYFYLDHDEVAEAFQVHTDSITAEQISALFDPVAETILNAVQSSARQALIDQLEQVRIEDMLSTDTLLNSLPALSDADVESLLNSLSFTMDEESLTAAARTLSEGYCSYLQKQGIDLAGQADTAADLMKQYLQSEEFQNFLRQEIQNLMREIGDKKISSADMQQLLSDEISAYLSWTEQINAGQENPADPADPTLLQMYFASDQGQARLQALAEAFTPAADEIDEEELSAFQEDLLANWQAYLQANGTDLIQPEDLKNSFFAYLGSDDAKSLITQTLLDHVDTSGLHEAVGELVDSHLQDAEGSLKAALTEQIETAVNTGISSISATALTAAEQTAPSAFTKAIAQAAAYINTHTGDFFTVDEEAFRNAIHIDLSTEQMQAVLNSLLNSNQSTLASNLAALGWCDPEEPTQIAIYARTFADKKKISGMLDDYNAQMKAAGEDDKVIVYTDVIAAMMDSITNIISTVSEILIGFVAISLVVSSIMIGVITYISVLERRKEIGVLRALGASRRNIREVFNAETIITGLLSGLLGIGFTFLLIPLADYLIWRRTGQVIQAWLPLRYALALIALSTVLTAAAGLIPAVKAARSDPVKALRTE